MPMKLLIFAHTPPPLHGQSYMVQLMLQGFGGDKRRRAHRETSDSRPGPDLGIECYHVNTRLSLRLEDIGEFHGRKLSRLLLYCFEAIWCRFRYGVENMYYIPAPGKKSALYRDWLVLLICRPFFKRIIFHWHAAGLGKWLETAVQMRTRELTYRFAKQVDLSIVLSRYNLSDAEKLLPRRVRVVGNGIPDPCPDFRERILSRRLARFEARRKLLEGKQLTATDLHETGDDPRVVKILFLAHCMEEKGLFDTLEAVVLANRELAKKSGALQLKVIVAGSFVNSSDRARFDQVLASPELRGVVSYIGFVTGEAKNQAFADADCFCFPSYYYAESFGLVLVEAMAFGLPIVTTRWRSLPELFPADYIGLVAPKAPEELARALQQVISGETGESFRERFLAHYTLEAHLGKLAEAIRSVEQPDSAAQSTPATVAS